MAQCSTKPLKRKLPCQAVCVAAIVQSRQSNETPASGCTMLNVMVGVVATELWGSHSRVALAKNHINSTSMEGQETSQIAS
jgi:hypothetical protein